MCCSRSRTRPRSRCHPATARRSAQWSGWSPGRTAAAAAHGGGAYPPAAAPSTLGSGRSWRRGHQKPISAPSLTGRYWISAWPLTAASGFLAACGLVILRHRHPAVGRPRHDSGLAADPRQPAQRPRHRGGLRLVQRRTTASPSAAFPLAGEPRNGPCQRLGLSRSWKTVSSPRISSTGTPKLGAHREDDPDANPVGENPGAPDRRPIEERLTGDLQHADPPGHPGQVAQQVITGFHPPSDRLGQGWEDLARRVCRP